MAEWPADQQAIKSVRERVFVDEQQVPPELEWDGTDHRCHHVVVFLTSAAGEPQPVATGRLQPDGKIGRMAVLPEHRSSGLGGKILKLLINKAKSTEMQCVFLSAQVHALAFYSQHGFRAYGDTFDEAGIQHRAMSM